MVHLHIFKQFQDLFSLMAGEIVLHKETAITNSVGIHHMNMKNFIVAFSIQDEILENNIILLVPITHLQRLQIMTKVGYLTVKCR